MGRIYSNANFPSYFKENLNPQTNWTVGLSVEGSQRLINDKGRTVSGAIRYQYEYISNESQNHGVLFSRTNINSAWSLGSPSQNTPMCVLAIPMISGCPDLELPNQYNQEFAAEEMRSLLNRQSFYYCFVWDTSTNITPPLSGTIWNINPGCTSYYIDFDPQYWTDQQIKYQYELISKYPTFTTLQSNYFGKGLRYGTVNAQGLFEWAQKVNNDYTHFADDIMALLQQLAEQLPTTIRFASMMQTDFRYDLFRYSSSVLLTQNKYTSAQIVSNMPIFSARSTEDIINYFGEGDFTPDNLEDLLLSEVNLKTDWTIYVKGARYPDIYVTMKSPYLENFLNSEENKTGLSKNDFKIQYKLPLYQKVAGDNALPPELKGYELYYTDTYNNNFATSWKELVQDSGINPNFNAMGTYAQLQFRLYHDNTKFSSWCFFKIGYIGSPTVPDFQYMQNNGGVVGISDSSTVTIIYDEVPPDSNDYTDPDNDTDITIDDTAPTGETAGLNLLTVSYRLTDNNVNELGDFLWSKSFFDNISLINQSPIENIVGLKIMPCQVVAETSSIKIGNVDTLVNGDKITSVPLVDVGSFSFQGYYQNFLDLNPYTQAILFLPFIGFQEIDCAQFVGHVLSVKYAFDIIMGECIAMLFVDGIYCQSYTGTCGVDVPLVASNRSAQEMKFVTNAISAMTTGDVLGIADAIVNNPFHSSRNGNYSSTLKWFETRTCYITLVVPNAQYPNNYGHNVGYPCNLIMSLSSLSGFTMCGGNIDMSNFDCTDTEKEMIRNMLMGGIYL